jgi:glucuronate isomerase
LLCDIIGRDVEAGLIPDDEEVLEQLVKDICINNAKNYFNLPNS